jgi:hypothetical protein
MMFTQVVSLCVVCASGLRVAVQNERDEKKKQLKGAIEQGSSCVVKIKDTEEVAELKSRQKRFARSSIYTVEKTSPTGSPTGELVKKTVDGLIVYPTDEPEPVPNPLPVPPIDEQVVPPNPNGSATWQKDDQVRLTGFEEGSKHQGFNGLVGVVQEEKNGKYNIYIMDPQPVGGGEQIIGEGSVLEVREGAQEIPANLKKVRNAEGKIVISLGGNRLQKYVPGELPSLNGGIDF